MIRELAAGAALALAATTLTTPAHADHWPIEHTRDCTPDYAVGIGNEDRYCLDVWWKLQEDGQGYVIRGIRVIPTDPGEYENPAAHIHVVAVKNGPSWCPTTGMDTKPKCPLVWSRGDVWVWGDDAARDWNPYVKTSKDRAAVHLNISPKVDNFGDPGIFKIAVDIPQDYDG